MNKEQDLQTIKRNIALCDSVMQWIVSTEHIALNRILLVDANTDTDYKRMRDEYDMMDRVIATLQDTKTKLLQADRFSYTYEEQLLAQWSVLADPNAWRLINDTLLMHQETLRLMSIAGQQHTDDYKSTATMTKQLDVLCKMTQNLSIIFNLYSQLVDQHKRN